MNSLVEMNLKGDVYKVEEETFSGTGTPGDWQTTYQRSWGKLIYTFNEHHNLVT